MLRPTISDDLEEAIAREMGDLGFDNEADFVRYACRRQLERLNGGRE